VEKAEKYYETRDNKRWSKKKRIRVFATVLLGSGNICDTTWHAITPTSRLNFALSVKTTTRVMTRRAVLLLYYFDQFVHHMSHTKWFWMKSVACPASHEEWSASKNHWQKKIWGNLLVRPIYLPNPKVVGQNFWPVTGHPSTGRCQNFVHLVTGHTPGRIDRNSTVVVGLGYIVK